MQYICRSCLLRLGQPWRMPTRHRALPQLLPNNTRRANHDTASHVEKRSQESHSGQHRWGRGPASTTDSAAPSTKKISAPPRGVPITKKNLNPRSRFVSSTSNSTPNYNNAEFFINKFDQFKGQSSKLEKILRRFGEWEVFQRERLANEYKSRDPRRAFSRFDAWKSAVKNAPPGPSSTATPMEERQLRWIRSCDSLEELMASMSQFSKHFLDEKKDNDRLLLSVALRYAPDKLHLVLELILRTHEKPSMPEFYIVEDVLELLASSLRAMEDSRDKEALAEKVADLIIYALENSRSRYIQISQATIYPVLDALPAADVEPYYTRLLATNCYLHPYTELQFASRLAKSSPTKELSAQILEHLTRSGLLDINTPMAASVCTSILTFSKQNLATLDGQSATPADLFRHLHSIGLVPNVITYSAIIRGLCLNNDLKTALDVFEVMKSHGVQPDAFTYSILINGCKLNRDFDAFAEFAIQACRANIRDPVVWTDILHGAYICCIRERTQRNGPRRTPLHIMNEIYSRIFDAGPVQPFITGRLTEMGTFVMRQQWTPAALTRLPGEIPPLPPLEVLKPGSDTLAVMILGLVRCLPMPYDVVVFYSQFRDMLRQGHPAAELLVRERGTFVHDVVLRNLVKWRGTLRVALDIIRDMTRDIGKDAHQTSSQQASAAMARPLGQSARTTDTAAANTGAMTASPQDLQTGAGTETTVNVESSPVSKVESTAANGETSSLSSGTPWPQVFQPVPGAPYADDSSAKPRSPIRHPAPSVYTWSILMHGFMRDRRPRDAEHILNIMREHGVESNIVTWNTLAAGYAKMQKIPEAVDAMRRLETHGFKADDWTMRAFSYIGNKQRAIRLMEATVEANKLKKMASESQELERELGPELETLTETAGDQWEPEQITEEKRDGDGLEQRQQDGDEHGLDQDLEARLGQTESGVLPKEVTRKILGEIRKMKKVAPINNNNSERFKQWAQVREHGLDAMRVPAGSDVPGRRNLSQVQEPIAG